VGLLLFAFASIMLVTLRAYSAVQASGRIYSFANVPERPVAIVFGAGEENGGPSPMLADRVEGGVKLYQAGKVMALLFTGDNHVTTYNEPEGDFGQPAVPPGPGAADLQPARHRFSRRGGGRTAPRRL
jgi:vancomycin permeability regulator SanA